ncbi:hypothetical protein HanXRQr2_Chr13g0571351 [Helianthus annuus]|uniref:Uncharacterized protein n=1 Tax=Helianthus annuus TaxID=4232 RepID=A0A9K3EED1_HELAN|nr:hypothetical protein HanXRQr2_Chr13g0571351 [Helianthus annuus]KAJ0847845.1 hypothetical protein HanPSC8_Chr13g0550071 [Helianthus annuus]
MRYKGQPMVRVTSRVRIRPGGLLRYLAVERTLDFSFGTKTSSCSIEPVLE